MNSTPNPTDIMNIKQIDKKPVILIEGKLAVRHEDWRTFSIEKYKDAPTRAPRRVHFLDLPSMMEYVRKDAQSHACKPAFFVGNNCVEAISNYIGIDGSPAWGDAVSAFTLNKTNEWLAWMGRANRALTQAQFVEHLEDYCNNIVSPNGSDVLTLIQRFKVARSVTFGSVYTSHAGVTELNYVSKEQDGSISLPDKLVLHLPVYEGAEELTTYELTMRLIVRLDEETKSVKFSIVPVRPDIPERNAMKDIAKSIKCPDVEEADGCEASTENAGFEHVFIGTVSESPKSILS